MDFGLVVAVAALALIVYTERRRFEREVGKHVVRQSNLAIDQANLRADMKNADKFIAELMDKFKKFETSFALADVNVVYENMKSILQSGPFAAIHHDDKNCKIEIVPRKEMKE